MYRIEQLHKGNLPELLEFLNGAFTGNPHSDFFETKLPKLWVDDDVHMEKHHVIREQGSIIASVGIYPFEVEIAGKTFRFATVGNMGTAESARGKGCMAALYEYANRVLREQGIDVARLGGKRSRYARFGYEVCGSMYRFDLRLHNAKEFLSAGGEELTLKPLTAEDTAALHQVRRLYTENGIFAHRGDDRELDLTMRFSHNVPYVALRDGSVVGYFTLGEHGICEASADSPDLLANMLCRAVLEQGKDMTVHLPPDRTADVAALAAFCEKMNVEAASHYKILNWAAVTEAAMSLRASRIAPLADGELMLEIVGHCTVCLKAEGGVGTCTVTDKPADLSLMELEASRFLFGPLPPFVASLSPEKARFAAANLPLPFYTLAHDKA